MIIWLPLTSVCRKSVYGTLPGSRMDQPYGKPPTSRGRPWSLGATTTDKIFHMGKLAEIKTKQTSASVAGFIDSISDEQQRNEIEYFIFSVRLRPAESPRQVGAGSR